MYVMYFCPVSQTSYISWPKHPRMVAHDRNVRGPNVRSPASSVLMVLDGRQLSGAGLHSSDEPGELSKWLESWIMITAP